MREGGDKARSDRVLHQSGSGVVDKEEDNDELENSVTEVGR